MFAQRPGIAACALLHSLLYYIQSVSLDSQAVFQTNSEFTITTCHKCVHKRDSQIMTARYKTREKLHFGGLYVDHLSSQGFCDCRAWKAIP